MFKIVWKGAAARLEADAKLTPTDFQRIADDLETSPVRARKIGFVAARKATAREVVETRWNGKETTNTAQPGDWIVTNLSPSREPLRDGEDHINVYVITPEKFASLYEATGESSGYGAIYRAQGVVSALPLPGGFDIMAPWGDRQTGATGYLLLNGDQVSGSGWDAFAETYQMLSG